MTAFLAIDDYIASWATSPFSKFDLAPWHVVGRAEDIVRNMLPRFGKGYRTDGLFVVHETAAVEAGVILKGAGVIGPGCLIAAGAYLRGGIFLAENCIVGPGAELKSTFMFAGSKIAHLNFVGDTLIGARVNIEAGAVVANFRNELKDKTIRILHDGGVIETGVTKFGALIGDDVRIGANAVVAPGAIITPSSRVGRLQLVDHHPYAV